MTPWSTISTAAVRAAAKTPEVEPICQACGRKLQAAPASGHHGGMTKYHVMGLAIGASVYIAGMAFKVDALPVTTLILGVVGGHATAQRQASKRDAAP